METVFIWIPLYFSVQNKALVYLLFMIFLENSYWDSETLILPLNWHKDVFQYSVKD